MQRLGQKQARCVIANRMYWFAIAVCALGCLACLCAAAAAAVPLQDYSQRLEQARKTASELTADELPASVVVSKLNGIKQRLPAREEVEIEGLVVHIDNTWLHESAGQIIENARGDVEQRHSMLAEIERRLIALDEQVKAAIKPPASASGETRARLESILARREYLPEEKQESSLQRWARKFRELIGRGLRKLFGSSEAREPAASPSAGSVVIFRAVILLAVAAALVYGAIRLTRLVRRRPKPEEEPEVREVLGETIADDATAADLLANASELARHGEYRAAIRRAYIALLFEMEQRGKLRLNRAKTNRDYLNALRTEQQIFPGFSSMTGIFEEVWYGQEQATESEFSEFVAKYRETTR